MLFFICSQNPTLKSTLIRLTANLSNSFPYYSLEPKIIDCVKEVGDLLLAYKGTGQKQTHANSGPVDCDDVLRPLMDLLDGSLSLYAQSCEKTVLKRLLKELWKIVMRSLEKSVVLPPMTDKSVSRSVDLGQLDQVDLCHRWT